MTSGKTVKIPGQGKKSDSAEKSFWKVNKRFAEVFNKTVFAGEPIDERDLEERDTDETAF